jgi:rhodanese-related sulfurtransferase
MQEYHISPREFHQKLETGEISPEQVLDVRELWEREYYSLDNTVSMPMNTIPGRFEELPRDQDLYVICAHGVRSVYVCEYLIGEGCGNVKNVVGGMAAVAELRGFQYD